MSNVIPFPKKRRINPDEVPPEVVWRSGELQKMAEIQVGTALSELMQAALLPRGPLTHASLLGLLDIARQGVLLDLMNPKKGGPSHA